MPHMAKRPAPICSKVVKTAIFQTSRMPRSDISMAMRKSSMSTPSSANTSTAARFSTKPRPVGPRMTPATM